VPVTSFCSGRGNLNAFEEIICREKKFPKLAPKMVQIRTFIGQFCAVLVLLNNLFEFASFHLD
jgi:hypothetical protein